MRAERDKEYLSGWPLSPEEIARMEAAVEVIAHQPLQLGIYDRSFFAGLALGRWPIKEVNWGGNQFIQRRQVVFGTESQDPYKRKLLTMTIGRYGSVHDGVKEWRVYLPYEQFTFMLEPEQEVEYQVAESARWRAAAYMMGLCAGKLERSSDQMIFQDEELPSKIIKGFKRNFHFDLGSLHQRKSGSWILYIHGVSQVLGMLVTRPSVYKLPFFRDLSAWSEPQDALEQLEA